jgi:regulatory protein
MTNAAGALVLAKSPRYGSRRLKQMLQARSFDADLISSSLQQTAGSELERARDVWQRRFGQAPCDLRERARQHRFLSARGFDAGVVERVMKEALTHPSAVIEQDDDA